MVNPEHEAPKKPVFHSPEDPLTADLTPDVAPAVEHFLEEAAEHNEAEAHSFSEDHVLRSHANTLADEAKAHDGPYIAFEHVHKAFGNFVVLDDVSFFVNPGETLCILGRSGVGKSVSLQILMGFLKADKGTVLVAGQDVAHCTEEQMQTVRHKVTMVFQNGALFDSISVGENVAFPLRERGGMDEEEILTVVKGLLEMVGVAGMAELLPSDLSTGMKRYGGHCASAGGTSVRNFV
ncbi:MAG: ATP-binding cassette domain-containing protein [Acidobacteriaceae bacterium]|nr:ATP-binding cassette domain-containing protein [Acidobacteriaceae bacterium]